ncbi:hypothetical protein P0D69_43465 [Paraburkholderia sediminicola]|uniref:hypothetical protein n=1 Tax=Paraburkholderia sediminicola TaxID=458836 RepID=UPI0038BB9A78
MLIETYKSAAMGLIVAVEIPDHLTPAPEQHRQIERAVRQGPLQGDALTQTEHCAVRIWDFSIEERPFSKTPDRISQEEVDNFVRTRTGRSNANLMMFFSPGNSALSLSLTSAKEDEVLVGMRRQFRDATKGQFSGTRPAMLAVQLHAITANALVNLAKLGRSSRATATGLQITTSNLLQRPSSAHIRTIAYSSHAVISSSSVDGTTHPAAPSYFIKNQSHPLYHDPRYGVSSLGAS